MPNLVIRQYQKAEALVQKVVQIKDRVTQTINLLHFLKVKKNILNQPFEAKANINSIQEFSLYQKENTMCIHYKHQLVNVV
jgi:uncharacterized protein YjgD (DUF1641 family)